MRQLSLLFLITSRLWAAETPVNLPAAVVEDKIRGGLLGQILGDLNGLIHENKYVLEPGKVEKYTPALPDGAWTDDDTDIEWIYLVEMERSKTMLLSQQRIAELWKRYINRKIWCSHLYLRQLLDLGIQPPLTGSVHVNPWASFNLSGQFVSESWGLIAPGMPRTAAKTAVHYIHTSVDLEPIQSAQMFSSMISMAFLTSDMEKLMDAGQAAVDPRSEMHQIIVDVQRWHRENPKDWRATRKLIQQKFSIHAERVYQPDLNGVKLNGACTLAALLYGEGDFVETLRHAFNFGWDADNNAATSGTVIGVTKGYKWLMDQGWNIKDKFANTSRDELPDESITRYGDRLITLAQQTVREQGGTVDGAEYWIVAQSAANIERLADPMQQLARLRSQLGAEIEAGIRKPTSPQHAARAAYLAIALDLADGLRTRNPDGWKTAIAALATYPKVMFGLFYDSAGDAGKPLRQRAIAAGLIASPKPPGKP
jgi:ADP-ribosylglycohydrolase